MNRTNCPPSPEWMSVHTAGHQASVLKCSHPFPGPWMYKLFPAPMNVPVPSFQIKPSRGARAACWVWTPDYAKWQTERGTGRRFSAQITARPLRNMCVLFTSPVGQTEPLIVDRTRLKCPRGSTELWGEIEYCGLHQAESGRGEQGNGPFNWRCIYSKVLNLLVDFQNCFTFLLFLFLSVLFHWCLL